jgi:hypothetical protein
MNTYTLTGYALYLPVSFYITIFVGRSLYRSGASFLLQSFNENQQLASICNTFLLTGYYLLNLGYVTMSVALWDHPSNFPELVHELSWRLGVICCGLAVIHYFNLFFLSRFHRQIQSLYNQVNI